MSGLRTSFLRLALAAVALCAAAPLSSAHAVELYWDPIPALTPPVRVVYTPTYNYGYVAPVVTTGSTSTASASASVNLNITTTPAAPVQHARDAYDTHGLVIAGAGMGAAMFFGDGLTSTAVAYRLHVGVAVGQGEFALRADLMPDALHVPASTMTGSTPAALYTIGATFNYRFLPDASLHPVAGVGVETTILDPHAAQGGAAFGVVARVGLELAYPIDSGALAFGIDVTGHHLIGQDAGFPEASANMLNVSAYGDWRF